MHIYVGDALIMDVRFLKVIIYITRKYLLRGYILGVLTHTTALDRLWEGDETLTMWFKIDYTHLGFALAGAV